jgi:hypothetical protein
MPEWLKGADCKSAGSAYDGSNPSPSTTDWSKAGVAQLARALAFQAKGRGFESRFPLQFSKRDKRPGGSGVEHVLGKDEVTGSIPVLGSI